MECCFSFYPTTLAFLFLWFGITSLIVTYRQEQVLISRHNPTKHLLEKVKTKGRTVRKMFLLTSYLKKNMKKGS